MSRHFAVCLTNFPLARTCRLLGLHELHRCSPSRQAIVRFARGNATEKVVNEQDPHAFVMGGTTNQAAAIRPAGTELHPVATGHIVLRCDFKNEYICPECWSGRHFHHPLGANGKPKRIIIVDCLGGGCQCKCRQLVAETKARATKRAERRGSSGNGPKKFGPAEDVQQLGLFEQKVA